MSTSKVIRDFSSGRYSDSELSVKTSHVITEMTDNPNFPEPNPALSDLANANDNYSAALKKVENGSKEDTVVKNNLRKSLELLLKSETDYVQRISGGDEAIILSSGFDVNKKSTTVGPLDKPTGFSIAVGLNKGSVVVNCDVVSHASFYEFELTETPVTPNSIWLKKTSTKHKLLIEGLTSGKQYMFRVAGAGSDPSRNYSDEISSFVL
jgi:hypothetical protein